MDEKLRQSIENRIEQQRSAIANQEAQLQQMQQAPQQLDLSSLAALTDAWTGSRFSQAYQRPETKEERARKAMYLQQGLDARKQDALKSELELLKLMGKNKKSGKELTQNMILKLNEGNAIPEMLSNLDQTISQNAKLFGPFKGRVGEKNPYDAESQSINAEMRAKSQAFGRYMEGGVLRKEDEEKYRKMFPQLSDTPEVAREKLRIVQDLLLQKQRSDMIAFETQGYDLSGVNRLTPASFSSKKPSRKIKGIGKGGTPPKTKEWNGKTYILIGDEWVAQ